MKYDDASWHSDGDFPKDLPREAGAIHTGMYLSWALLNGLAGEIHLEEFPEGIEELKSQNITPAEFFLKYCDGKFTDEDLNEVGNQFTIAYFDLQRGSYLNEYSSLFGEAVPSLYHVEDTWENYAKVSALLSKRFTDWKNK
jgi:hypothetical protein